MQYIPLAGDDCNSACKWTIDDGLTLEDGDVADKVNTELLQTMVGEKSCNSTLWCT